MYVFINTSFNIQLHSINMDLDNIKVAFEILYATTPEFISQNTLDVFDEEGNKIETFTYTNGIVQAVNLRS